MHFRFRMLISCLQPQYKFHSNFQKTKQLGKWMVINLFSTSLPICLVESSYMKVWPCEHDSFFCHAVGALVTRYQASASFSMLVTNLGLDTGDSRHSFRIGAATETWFQGKEIDTIAKASRWKSICMLKCKGSWIGLNIFYDMLTLLPGLHWLLFWYSINFIKCFFFFL